MDRANHLVTHIFEDNTEETFRMEKASRAEIKNLENQTTVLSIERLEAWKWFQH